MAIGNTPRSDTQNDFTDTALLTEKMDNKTSGASGSVKGKQLPNNCVVRLLEGTDFHCHVANETKGQELVNKVCQHLNLEEKDYFSLSYVDDKNVRFWLCHDKTVVSQLKNKRSWKFLFEVKFYPVEPESLKEDVTRYQLCLQVRTDILTGKLPCSFVTHQLLGSYIVQSELGDYDIDEHGEGINYIKQIKFVPGQTEELLEKISKLHETNRGMSPMEAEASYLDNAKRLAFYGVDLHEAKVRGNQVVAGTVFVGVSAHGISVFSDKLTIYRWPWQKILDFSYTRNGFKVTIRSVNPRAKPDVYKYSLTYGMAKRLWQSAVEHHAFFRLSKPVEREPASFPKVGKSKFRYSGRTQQQVSGGPNVERPTPFINRGNNTRFFTLGRSGTLDTSTAGYSTDRGEKYHIDVSRSNTLDLKDRKKPKVGSSSDLDGISSPVPMAGFEDDRNLTAVGDHGYDNDDDSHIALLTSGRVNYSKAPYQYPGTQGTPNYEMPDTSMYRDSSMQDYSGGEFGRSSINGSKFGNYDSPERSSTIKQTTINVVMTANRNGGLEGDEMLPPYQENLLRHQGASAGARTSWETGSGWGSSMSREAKTSSRTYTDSEGNVITEFTTERENIIERRVEKRTIIAEGDEDFDHDQALLEAIQSVTEMNPDLSVQKIEIQTTAERI